MILRFGNYLLREETRELLRDGKPVTMTAKSFAVLQVLVQARGEVVSKQHLMATVWADSYVDDGSVSQNIFVLRKLLAADFPETPPIETVARLGYRFRIPVEDSTDRPSRSLAETLLEDFPAAAETGTRAEAVIRPELPPQSAERPWRVLLSLAALILLLVVASLLWYRSYRGHRSARTSVVAILPFRNLGGSHDQDWISDALREMLTTDLANGTTLRILPEETVDRARVEVGMTKTDGLGPETIQRLRRDIGCDRILTGSYVETNGDIRLDLRLIDAATGQITSSSSIVRRMEYLEALAADSSSRIRAALVSPPRSPSTETALNASVAATPQAYRLYVDARIAARQFNKMHTIDLLQQSIALDGRFALSRMALADAYDSIGEPTKSAAEAATAEQYTGSLSREQQLELGALGDTLSKHFAQAKAKYEALAALHPENPRFLEQSAWLSIADGKPQQSIEEVEALWHKFPDERGNPILYGHLTDAYGTKGEWKKALDAALQSQQLAEERGAEMLQGRMLASSAQARMHLHDEATAMTETEKALEIAKRLGDFSGELRASNRLSQLYLLSGKLNEAKVLLEASLAREQQAGEVNRRIHTLSTLGELAAKTGDHKAALAWYQQQLEAARTSQREKYILHASINCEEELAALGRSQGSRQRLKLLAATADSLGDKDAGTSIRKLTDKLQRSSAT